MDGLEQVRQCNGFQWDEANAEKNFIKHEVTPTESEQIFFDQPLIVAMDTSHSHLESRYYVLGQTDSGRLLFASFTARTRLIRVISARPMSRQERRIYEKKTPKFKTEDHERKFWATHDSSEYVDWDKGKKMVLSDLKPSVVSISIRLPESMLAELKLLANKTDIPYQSLMKMFLSERLHQELVLKRSNKKRAAA